MSVKSHYEQLHQAAGSILGASFSDGRANLMAESHAYIHDLGTWASVLGARKEVVAFQTAIREYQFAMLALSLGNYRSAFSALRLFLELGFSSIRWSVNEQEFREWLRGERDLNWTALVELESGILSKKVLRLYSDLFVDEAPAYRSSAVAVYRECSQFIHGNASTNRTLPPTLEFDQAAFALWHERASVTRLVITFALASRYLSDLSQGEVALLESGLLDSLGHSPAVRELLGAPVEAQNA